jgi:hypothetical protein
MLVLQVQVVGVWELLGADLLETPHSRLDSGGVFAGTCSLKAFFCLREQGSVQALDAHCRLVSGALYTHTHKRKEPRMKAN